MVLSWFNRTLARPKHNTLSYSLLESALFAMSLGDSGNYVKPKLAEADGSPVAGYGLWRQWHNQKGTNRLERLADHLR